MYKREEGGLFLVLAGFAAFFVINRGHNEAVRMYPYIVCGMGFILTAVQLGITFYKEKNGIDIKTSAALTKEQFTSIAVTLAASILYVFLINIVGYFVMTFIFVAGYSFWHTKTQKKWVYPAVALGVDIVIYIAFKLFLNIPLPTGFLI